jgi:superfamily I DNA and/or RNA helicase
MNFNRDLKQDYERILKDIIVPITSEIISCNVESDDFGDMIWYYSDSELRNIQFRLQDKIKEIHHVYDENNTGIIETRVIYKHSIKPIQLLDLNREYGIM